MEKLTEDILNKKTEAIKDWLLEVSEESDIDSDVITARTGTARSYDQFLCRRVHGVSSHGRVP